MIGFITRILSGRTIELMVGAKYSQLWQAENGTQRGSVCSPVLIYVVINLYSRKLKEV